MFKVPLFRGSPRDSCRRRSRPGSNGLRCPLPIFHSPKPIVLLVPSGRRGCRSARPSSRRTGTAVGRTAGLLGRELEARAHLGEVAVAGGRERGERGVSCPRWSSWRRARRAEERVDHWSGSTVALMRCPTRVVDDADREVHRVEERLLLEVGQQPGVRTRAAVVVQGRRIDVPGEEIRQGPGGKQSLVWW